MKEPRHSFGIAIFLLLVIAFGWWLLDKPWTGITADGDKLKSVGTYRSLDECTKEVEKTGGFCGKDCENYGAGSIANCITNVPIPRK
jgi:hypothetical protein